MRRSCRMYRRRHDNVTETALKDLVAFLEGLTAPVGVQ